jgi:hypothetical protein
MELQRIVSIQCHCVPSLRISYIYSIVQYTDVRKNGNYSYFLRGVGIKAVRRFASVVLRGNST